MGSSDHGEWGRGFPPAKVRTSRPAGQQRPCFLSATRPRGPHGLDSREPTHSWRCQWSCPVSTLMAQPATTPGPWEGSDHGPFFPRSLRVPGGQPGPAQKLRLGGRQVGARSVLQLAGARLEMNPERRSKSSRGFHVRNVREGVTGVPVAPWKQLATEKCFLLVKIYFLC